MAEDNRGLYSRGLYLYNSCELRGATPLSWRQDIADLEPELELHGLYVDEALAKLDQFLNDAFVAGLSQVRIVHGKGTGALREAVRDTLRRHPLVKSFRPGKYGEGGAGVTVAELSDRY